MAAAAAAAAVAGVAGVGVRRQKREGTRQGDD